MTKHISRRQVLMALAAAAGKLGLGALIGCAPKAVGLAYDEPEPGAYLPLVSNGPTPTRTPTPTPTPTVTPPAPPPTDSRVVHVHSEEATFWSGQTDYWNYVDQDVVDTMVDRGLMALTGTSSIADAWNTLLPDYKAGQGIAIKVNLNHTGRCTDVDGQIDALIHPVNALVRGLKARAVAESDIWIFDAQRWVPDRFVDGALYDGVEYFDKGCHNIATFQIDDRDALVAFSPPAGTPIPPDIRVTDVLIDATYVINMPILKIHGCAGVTLGFKNHFGSIDNPSELHEYVCLGWNHYRSDYNPLVDLDLNPHVGGKTVLTVGDGLIAAKRWNVPPDLAWNTFEGSTPESLFFSADPVAIDCVMHDFLAAEVAISDQASDYLRYAADMHLGTYEHGDPWGSGYSVIDYSRVEL